MAYSEGSQSCEKCGAGSFANNSTSCEKCPVGTFGQDGTCSQCPLGKVSFVQGSLDCIICPSNTTYLNATYCKEADGNLPVKPEEEVVPNKSGSNAVIYLLGITLVIVLVFVAISKRKAQNSEHQKDMKAVLVHHDESEQNHNY